MIMVYAVNKCFSREYLVTLHMIRSNQTESVINMSKKNIYGTYLLLRLYKYPYCSIIL